MPTSKVYVSRIALARMRSNSFVRDNINRYIKEIVMIGNGARNQAQVQSMGEFRVSPLGRSEKGLRVAWHLARDPETGNLAYFIDDLLYHEKEDRYVDDWGTKAVNGEIRLKQYQDATYVTYDVALFA